MGMLRAPLTRDSDGGDCGFRNASFARGRFCPLRPMGLWLAVMLVAGACAGCDLLAYTLVKTVGPFVPPDEVKAEFRMDGRSLLVLADTSDPSLKSQFPRLEVVVGEAVAKVLREQGATGPIVPIHSLEAARMTRTGFDRWSIAEVGEYFNVDLVLYVELYEFRLKGSPGSMVWRGYAESALRVVSPETGEQVWPSPGNTRIVTAETLPDVQPAEPGELERILVEGLADKIARHFFTYKTEDLPMRPKVK